MNSETDRAERLRELAGLVAHLSFTHERADYREGPHWSVYAHPWQSPEEKGGFDALIHMTPRTSDMDTGLELPLIVRCGNRHWLPGPGKTARQGVHQVWFRDLPVEEPDREQDPVPFTARLCLSEGGVEGVKQGDEVGPGDPLWTERRLAASSGDRTQEKHPSEPHIYYPHDRRIVFLLEEGDRGEVVLTVDTEAPELEGATVRFAFGQEVREVRLGPADPPGVWTGRCPLSVSFEAARNVVLRLDRILLTPEGEP